MLNGRSRSKSSGTADRLPPAIPQATLDRTEALKKMHGRPKTAHKNVRPETSNYKFPPFPNKMRAKSLDKSVLRKKNTKSDEWTLPKLDYGRSLTQEKINDLGDELLQTKQKLAESEKEKKTLNTRLRRLDNESAKRERFIETIVAGRYQPAEVHDTHLARTMTSITQKNMARDRLIEMQQKELQFLRAQLANQALAPPLSFKPLGEPSKQEEYETGEESDYPEEPEVATRTNGILKTSFKPRKVDNNIVETPILEGSDESDKEEQNHIENEIPTSSKPPKKSKEEEREKARKKRELEQRYIDQNAKLKTRMNEIKTAYVDKDKAYQLREDNLRRQLELSESQYEAKQEALNNMIAQLNTEKNELENTIKSMTEKLNVHSMNSENTEQDMREAYGEIDALRMENERLHNAISDLETRSGHFDDSVENYLGEINKPINIPRLDMTDVEHSDQINTRANSETPILTDDEEEDVESTDNHADYLSQVIIPERHINYENREEVMDLILEMIATYGVRIRALPDA